MTSVDAAILDAAEWLCRRFQVLTGRTNVWLAVQLTNLSIVVYFVWAGLYFWTRDDTGVRVAIGAICGGVLYGLTKTIFRDSLESHEQSAYRRVANGLRNPRRIRDALLRLQFLILSVVLAGPMLLIYTTLQRHVVLLSYPLIVLTTIILYLLACDPLPPCQGRVTAWLRGPALSPRPSSPETSPEG